MPRITGKEAEGLMAAYAKVHAPKEEEVAIEEPVIQTPTEDIQEDNLKEFQTRGTSQSAIDRQNRINALRKQAKPFMNQGKVTVSSNNSSGTPQKVNNQSTQAAPTQNTQARPLGQTQQAAANIDAMRSPAIGSRKVQPGLIGKLLPNHPGNTGGGGQTSTQTKPELSASPNMTSRNYTQSQANTLNQKFQAQINSPSNRFSNEMDNLIAQTPVRGSTGGQKSTQTTGGNTPQSGGQQQRTFGGQGNRQRPVKTGGIQLGKSIRGGLGALGNLAGRAVGGIKQGAQAVAGGIKQGVQKVAGALQNKGPIQGRLSGPQRRAQQTQQTRPAPQAAPTPQAKPAQAAPQAQAKPQAAPVNTGKVTPTAAQTDAAKADTTSPAAKAGLSADLRAQAAANTAAFKAKRDSQTPLERRNERLAAMKNKGRPLLRNNYDLIDDTINFLISEGYVTTESDALSIMSEPEFMESFNIGFSEVLNESSENNK